MRRTKVLVASALACAVCAGSAFAAEEQPSTKAFSVLAAVKATPMAASELSAVRGAHVHFLDPNGGLHLAGNPENQGIGTGNWYNNGSPESVENGELVAPSYHGLCVAAGRPTGILIPPVGPDGLPTLPQCP